MSDTTEDVVQGAVDIIQIILGLAVSAAVGIAVGIVIWLIIRVIAHRSDLGRHLLRRVKYPFFAASMTTGIWVFLGYPEVQPSVSQTFIDAQWAGALRHAILIVLIVLVAWMLAASAHTIEDVTRIQSGKSTSRRLVTQAQVLRRIVQMSVWTLAICAAILTFPSARIAMGSILASAGVISLVAGLAAQDSLSNMFAGVQITFTDALRVGDIVVVDGVQGTVEEVTLTYVVMKLWDDRRIIVPSTQFTKNSFENWTRLHSKLLGTVELKTDWNAPMPAIRAEVDRLLAATDLWDHRTLTVQVTDSDENWKLVRIVVSAENAGSLWDLRCYLREHLIDWVTTNAPYAQVRHLYQEQRVREVERDRSEEEIVRLASELAELSGYRVDDTAENAVAHSSSVEEARLNAAKRRASKVRRKRLRDRKPRQNGEPAGGSDPSDTSPAATQLLSEADIAAIRAMRPHTHRSPIDGSPIDNSPSETTAVRDRLYSGSEAAEERSHMFDGPAAAAMREREDTRVLRAFFSEEISAADALARLEGNEEAQRQVRHEDRNRHHGSPKTHEGKNDD